MICVVFDMDGVIYRGDRALPGGSACVSTLRAHGIKVGFLTNNSSRTREDYLEKFAEMGIDVTVEEIMTSGEATGLYLSKRGATGKPAFVIGRDGLAGTLRKYGLETDMSETGPPCDFVIVGWDRNIAFWKIARAQFEICTNGAKLIATNADAMFPTEGGKVLPGAGAMVAAVEVASGQKAEVIGKPKTISLKFLLHELGIPTGSSSDQVWFVGDRLDTDVACGKAYGARTVLVTTGITDREAAECAPEEMRPDSIIDSLSELPGLIV